jgi:hypothetical protein
MNLSNNLPAPIINNCGRECVVEEVDCRIFGALAVLSTVAPSTKLIEEHRAPAVLLSGGSPRFVFSGLWGWANLLTHVPKLTRFVAALEARCSELNPNRIQISP